MPETRQPDPRLKTELLRSLRQRLADDATLVLVSHTALSGAVAVAAISQGLGTGLWIWLGVMLVMTLVRARWLRACRGDRIDDALLLRGNRLLTLLHGLCWGIGALWLVRLVPMEHLATLCVAVGGLATAITGTLEADPPSYYRFLGAEAGLFAVGLLLTGHLELGAAVLVGGAVLILRYRRAYTVLISHLRTSLALRDREAALRESESRFRRIADSNVVGICFWEADGNIPWANGELLRISGHTPDDLMAGRVNWRAMSPAEYGPRNQQLLEAAARGETVALEERDLLRSDGSRIRIMLGIAPLQNATSRGLAIVLDLSALAQARNAREQLITQLKESLSNVRTLTDLLPICSVCKKIRDDDGYWSGVEKYITEHTGTMFSHGVCPDCFPVLFPDVTV